LGAVGGERITKYLNFVKEGVVKATESVKDLAVGYVGFLRQSGSKVADLGIGYVNFLKDKGGKLGDFAKGAGDKVLKFGEDAKETLGGFKDTALNMVERAKESIFRLGIDFKDMVPNFVKDIFNFGKDMLPDFKDGGFFSEAQKGLSGFFNDIRSEFTWLFGEKEIVSQGINAGVETREETKGLDIAALVSNVSSAVIEGVKAGINITNVKTETVVEKEGGLLDKLVSKLPDIKSEGDTTAVMDEDSINLLAQAIVQAIVAAVPQSDGGGGTAYPSHPDPLSWVIQGG
jgi:hypothetical protein